MGASAVMSLVWTRLLVHSMGSALYGLFVSFQAIPRLGGLGDFGISGAVGIRTGQMIGRNEQGRLIAFLASARALFLVVAPLLGGIFFLLSPFLPAWLGFKGVPGSGSLTLLFQTGAVALFLTVLGGYIYSVNAGTNNIVWPIIPSFVLAQVSLLGHWLLAQGGYPLWVQNCSYLLTSMIGVVVVWWLLKIAHPAFSALRPITVNLVLWRELLSTSGWFYLYTLGGFIFTMTDRLLVNGGFGASTVTAYVLNYKPCEMAMQVLLSATFASQTKINQWIANPAPEAQERARQEVQRLNLFQSAVGVACALAYLALDNLFVDYWVGPAYQMPTNLQWAFALTLAITAAGDAGIQMAGLCGPKGLRKAGLAIGLTGLLNLALSLAAMRNGWLVGIAYATVVAQTVLSIVLAFHTCRYLKIPVTMWLVRSWLLPVLAVLALAVGNVWINTMRWSGALSLLAIGAVVWLLYARLAGLNRDFFAHEWKAIRRMLSL